jgi:hypothetical protein
MSRKTQWLKPKYVIGIIKQSKPIQLQGRTKKSQFFSDVRPHKLGDKAKIKLLSKCGLGSM